MKARITWIEDVAFRGETESGHALVMDGSPEAGGRNLGPRPMETVLIGTSRCVITLRLFSCTNSIGSSIVTMCREKFSLM